MAERKKFIGIEIPLLGKSIQALGPAELLDKKTITLDLSRRLKGKGLNVTFEIFSKDKKLIGVPKKMELVKAFIRRIMRKRVNYVEDSFVAKCLDLEVTVKPFLITRRKVSRVVRKNLRNTAKEFLLEYIKEKNYHTICEELLDSVLQKALLPKLKKIYPLAFCDLRIFETKELKKFDLSTLTQPQEQIQPEQTGETENASKE